MLNVVELELSSDKRAGINPASTAYNNDYQGAGFMPAQTEWA